MRIFHSSYPLRLPYLAGTLALLVTLAAGAQEQPTASPPATVATGPVTREEVKRVDDKVPILGDIPVVNTLFKSQDVRAQHTELLIFMTCNIMPDDHFPDLTPFQQEKFDELGATPRMVNGTRDLVRTYTHPEEQRDPIYKWRRAK